APSTTSTRSSERSKQGSMDDRNAELAVDSRCELGEGIIWDAARACLWWTDIDGRQIWRFDPASKATARVTPPDRVGFMAVATGGRLLVGAAKALYMVQRPSFDA